MPPPRPAGHTGGMSSNHAQPGESDRDAATAPVCMSASPVAAGPQMPLHEVLDRLGPSIFAGLVDTDGVLRYANQPALQVIGSSAEQVLGQRFDSTP